MVVCAWARLLATGPRLGLEFRMWPTSVRRCTLQHQSRHCFRPKSRWKAQAQASKGKPPASRHTSKLRTDEMIRKPHQAISSFTFIIEHSCFDTPGPVLQQVDPFFEFGWCIVFRSQTEHPTSLRIKVHQLKNSYWCPLIDLTGM